MSRFATPIVGKIKDYVIERDFSAGVSIAAEEGEWDAQASIQLLPYTMPPGAGTRVAPPALATAADLREVVQYLKKKPFGVTVVEALNDVKKRVFEPRKIAAYEFCGIVTRGGDRLHLTSLGWEFASKIEPETEAYRAVLDNTPLYRATLEWIHRQNLDLVTHKDVAAYWLGDHASVLEQKDNKTLESNALCFFHLSQAAELGTVTIGKRGQPARLRVEREELTSYIESREPQTASRILTGDAGRVDDEADAAIAASRSVSQSLPPAVTQQVAGQKLSTTADSRRWRVFISSSGNSKIVRQIQPMLELADIEACFAERLEPEAVPVSDHALQAMRECDAAIIVVTREDCCGGAGEATSLTFQQNILIEIGAAFVLYERRVVLLIDERLPLPPNLSGLTCFTFDEGDLTWDAGVKLTQAVKDFKSVRAAIG